MYSAALRYIFRSIRRNSYYDKCSATESLCAHDKFSRFSTHYMMLLIQGRRVAGTIRASESVETPRHPNLLPARGERERVPYRAASSASPSAG